MRGRFPLVVAAHFRDRKRIRIFLEPESGEDLLMHYGFWLEPSTGQSHALNEFAEHQPHADAKPEI